ncbi:VWA domain-containing protein [Shewanella gelidimarina]|uniref:vWA domain-containing protein n=1 Tax=Shewanella gelidimarina TaxID=56813 RepID=UPI00200E3159|nr:VWA domain-containing protein [Shewanella gelidimarina]MCL1058669.1 VWA domain-containing protein [Shewanella gelidimarina]
MTGFNPSDFTVAKAKPLPVVLLLDVSTSMQGNSINELNVAVKEMFTDFANAEKNEIEILVSIITFGAEVLLHTPYTSAKDIEWQDMTVSGMTPMGTAFSMAKAMIEDKETTPSRAYRPTIVLVSDGAPNDSWEQPLRELVKEGRSQKCDRMAMAIGSDTSNSVLNEFVSGTENKVFTAQDSSQIQEFFKFVTMSVTTRTQSQNANVVPKQEEVQRLVEQEDNQPSEELEDEFI